ncbi:MAG: hypothetical protein EXR71_16360 [Myxococcales bacterium]|nr:hypothetical protein [Myxococcales bacterium]
MAVMLLWLLVVLVVGALLGGIAGSTRGRGVDGALLGFCFGPFGAVVAIALPPSRAVVKKRERDLRELRRELDTEESDHAAKALLTERAARNRAARERPDGG